MSRIPSSRPAVRCIAALASVAMTFALFQQIAQFAAPTALEQQALLKLQTVRMADATAADANP